jgi:TonB family protein
VNYLGPSLRRTRKRSRPWVRTAVALGLSLLANAAALRFVTVGRMVGTRPGEVNEAPQAVELTPLSSKEWAANRVLDGTRPQDSPSSKAAPAVTQPPPPPPPRQAAGQVVDVAPSKNQTPPKESRFLAEHDSTVDKETRSRYRGPGFANPLPKPSEPDATGKAPPSEPAPPVVAGSEKKEGVEKQGEHPTPAASAPQAHGPQKAPEQASREKLALAEDPRGEMRLHGEAPVKPGDGGAPAPGASIPPSEGREGEAGPLGTPGKPGLLQLRPSAAVYDRLAGGPAPDKLDGVEEGESTYLNTREWKYASYFVRIKRQLSNTWDPSGAMRAHDPTGEGARYGAHDWVTWLAVRLDEQGGLREVVVQRSSGLDFLDTAAVQAFKRAQPFVNPPHGLVDERGEIAFSFGFSFEVSRGLASLFGRAPPANE